MSIKPKLRAWVRPLKNGHVQYFASCPDGYVWGTARSYAAAAGLMDDLFVPGGYSYFVETLKPYGKWADR